MKRTLICGLLVSMLVALPVLAACSSSASPTVTPAAQGKTAEAPAEVIKLKYASTFQTTESGTKIGYHFLDYVEQKSGGRVKFERFPGSVLGAPPEFLKLVGSGSVDVVSLPHMIFKDELPLLQIPEWAPGSAAKALDYFNKVVFENAETAPLLEKEAKENNVKFLNFTAGGANVIISKTVFNSLADLKGKKFGAGAAQKVFSELGFVPVNMFPPDGYESLSRGIVDATHMGLAPTLTLKWYEVSKCYRFDGTYAAGNPITVNLNTWNKLPADIQQIFKDGAKAAADFSIELDKTSTEADVQTLKNAGIVVGPLPEADTQLFFKTVYKYAKEEMLDRAAKRGKSDEANKIMEYVDQVLGQ